MYVTSHGLDSLALQEVICRAMNVYPQDTSRIERAIDLVFDNKVTNLIADMWLVNGSNGTNYIVDATGCPCEDAQWRPQYTCKHQWAINLVQWTQRRQWSTAQRKVAA